MNIAQLQQLKETEDKVEFKEGKHNFTYNGGSHNAQEERRKCYLGYIVAFANECGGTLVLGMADAFPHQVVGSDFGEGKIGALEDDVYAKLGIRIRHEELDVLFVFNSFSDKSSRQFHQRCVSKCDGRMAQ